MSMTLFTPSETDIVHKTKVDLILRPVQNMIHLVQYDDRLPLIEVELYRMGHLYTLPEDAVVWIRWGVKDHAYTRKMAYVSSDRTKVYIRVTYNMCYFYGNVRPIVVVEDKDGKSAGSSPLEILIDKDPVQYSEGPAAPEDEILEEIKNLVEGIDEDAEEAKQARDEAVAAATTATTKAEEASNSATTATTAKNDAVEAKNTAVSSATAATNAKDDAVEAKDTAINAKNDAVMAKETAVNASTTATNAKNDAVTAKNDAVTAKDTAVSSATTATNAKNDAVTAKDTAVSSATTASTKAEEASISATTATTAATTATTAKDDAVTAKEAAEAAAEAASETVEEFRPEVIEIKNSYYNLTEVSTGTQIMWTKFLIFTKTANTTFTFETAKENCSNEYKAKITNGGTASIILTFTGVTNILCNDDNCVILNNTLTLPTGVTIEISVLGGNMVAINFEA